MCQLHIPLCIAKLLEKIMIYIIGHIYAIVMLRYYEVTNNVVPYAVLSIGVWCRVKFVLSLNYVELTSVWLNWCWFNCWCLLNKISVVVWGHGGCCATVCRVAMVAVVLPFVALILFYYCWYCIMLRKLCRELRWENYVENYVENTF